MAFIEIHTDGIVLRTTLVEKALQDAMLQTIGERRDARRLLRVIRTAGVPAVSCDV